MSELYTFCEQSRRKDHTCPSPMSFRITADVQGNKVGWGACVKHLESVVVEASLMSSTRSCTVRSVEVS